MKTEIIKLISIYEEQIKTREEGQKKALFLHVIIYEGEINIYKKIIKDLQKIINDPKE